MKRKTNMTQSVCDSPSQQTRVVQKVCWIHHKHLNFVPADTLGTEKLIFISHWKKNSCRNRQIQTSFKCFLYALSC